MIVAFGSQDEQFSRAFSQVREAITQRAFPTASIAVTHLGKLVALKSFGRFVWEEDLKGDPFLSRTLRQDGEVDVATKPSTLFDLASLTKPVATAAMAMILYERGLLDLNAPISATVPEFLIGDERRRNVTFRMLLAHSSGLPAYEKLYLKAHNRDELLRAAFATELTADPGTCAEYSDIGFIILGVAQERLAEEPLDLFCQREIFGPLGMTNTTFNPPPEIRALIPPTADERADRVIPSQPRSTFRDRIIQGEVQDENAFVLGGVAGHAGLFATAEDVASFAHSMISGGSGILRADTMALFTRRESTPAGTSRALGWDTPSAPSQSGTHFGPRSYGHLGYTGTSLWIDPDRQLSITLLTNRTWPDCSNHAIKHVRPKVYDSVMQALDATT